MAKTSTSTIKLNYDGFAQLLGYFGKKRKAVKLKRRIDAAWASLLSIDATNGAGIESAVAAARAAGETSSDYVELEAQFREPAGNRSHPKSVGPKTVSPNKQAGRQVVRQTTRSSRGTVANGKRATKVPIAGRE